MNPIIILLLAFLIATASFCAGYFLGFFHCLFDALENQAHQDHDPFE